MIHFTPTLGIFDTVKNAYSFIGKNQNEFWALIKKIAPTFTIALAIVSITTYLQQDTINEYISEFTEKYEQYSDEEALKTISKEFSEKLFEIQMKYLPISFLAGLVIFYLTSAVAISWHRLIIHGPSDYRPMKITSPKKSEFMFMLMLIVIPLIGSLIIIAAAILAILFETLTPGLMWIGFILLPVSCFVYLIAVTRMTFYLPSKATGLNLTLKQSYHLAKGYVWKLCMTYIIAFIPIIIISIAIMTTHLTAMSTIGTMSPQVTAILTVISHILTPVSTILAVTVLSNYYQHALQNKGLPGAKNDT
jgi:hypothetical protein